MFEVELIDLMFDGFVVSVVFMLVCVGGDVELNLVFEVIVVDGWCDVVVGSFDFLVDLLRIEFGVFVC